MTGRTANMPYIKSEPEDFGNNQNGFMNSFHSPNNMGHQFTQQNNGSINPSELSMSNGTFNPNYNFNGQNMSSSFSMGGNAAFDDDELLDSINEGHDFSGMHPQQYNGMQMNQQQMNGMYSNTPDGAPIQSPFMGGFDYSQFRTVNSLPPHMSPHQNPSMMNKRPSMQTSRKTSSDQRSPMTPQTASRMAGLNLGTSDPNGMQNGRTIRHQSIDARHGRTLSGQFDNTPGSAGSFLDSPLVSPNGNMHPSSISEAIAMGKSLPSKVESGGHQQSLESQEAKKKRRRASHNAVERRRRDNINERIQDLSHIVPQHRLDDDRVRKQLASHGPLSPTIGATSMSPPNAATSLLAGANGRRAASTAGNITLGLPLDEKEKGPNKGDILNGSVTWTRDCMWGLYQKYVQDEELAQYITSLGGSWPFQISDDEKRLRSEVMEAVERNDPTTFSYSRTDGTGLRVPKFTTMSGEKLLNGSGTSMSPSSNIELSPGFHSGGSGTQSGSNGGHLQFWSGSTGHTGMSLKEDDEEQFMALDN